MACLWSAGRKTACLLCGLARFILRVLFSQEDHNPNLGTGGGLTIVMGVGASGLVIVKLWGADPAIVVGNVISFKNQSEKVGGVGWSVSSVHFPSRQVGSDWAIFTKGREHWADAATVKVIRNMDDADRQRVTGVECTFLLCGRRCPGFVPDSGGIHQIKKTRWCLLQSPTMRISWLLPVTL